MRNNFLNILLFEECISNVKSYDQFFYMYFLVLVIGDTIVLYYLHKNSFCCINLSLLLNRNVLKENDYNIFCEFFG